MTIERDGLGYNERLFSGGLRGYLHTSRYRWLREELLRLECGFESVLELGCFDGKLIEFLPPGLQHYCGYDANWECGLDIAATKWRGYPQYEFHKATSAADIELRPDDQFDIAVIMETLEHLTPDVANAYLDKIRRHVKQYVFITVPNEKGMVFLSKWLYKRIILRKAPPYTPLELINATLGRLHKVPRHQHKGFDYAVAISQVGSFFEVITVSGIPFRFLPPALSYTVGMVGRVRTATLHR